MYRIKDIVTAFLPLVGWEQGKDIRIAEELTQSASGLYFQEAHPLLTLRAMRGIMPERWEEGYEDFSLDKHYLKGEKAKFEGKVYKAKENTYMHSVADTDYWLPYDVLSDYLESLEIRGIKNVIKRFIEDKVKNYETRNLIDRRCFFDGMGRNTARVINTNKLVGFEINPLKKGGATMKAEKVGVQFVGNNGEITLYLFHSSESAPVWSKTINYTAKNGAMQWFDLDGTFFSFLKDGSEGSWYLCYAQNELPDYMEAINVQRDWSKSPCVSCNKGDVALWREINNWAEVSPFYVAEFNGTMWDKDDTIYTPGNNYGLNLQISLACDLTDTIIENRDMFASAIQLEVACEALRTLVLNPEVSVNRVQYNAERDNILYEVEGNGQSIKGLKGELERAYKALEFNTSTIDPHCITCHTKGIRIGAI